MAVNSQELNYTDREKSIQLKFLGDAGGPNVTIYIFCLT